MWQSVNGKPQLIVLGVSCWPFSEHDSFFMVVCDIRDQESYPTTVSIILNIHLSITRPRCFSLAVQTVNRPVIQCISTNTQTLTFVLHLTWCNTMETRMLEKKKKVYSGQIISLQDDPNIAILKGFFPSLRQRRVSVTSAIVLPPTCTPASHVSTLAASTLRTTCTFMSRLLDTH